MRRQSSKWVTDRVLDVAVRKDNFASELLQLSATPTLNTSTLFSFTRRCPATYLPIQLGLRTPIHSKHSPTFTPIMACGRLGGYKEQPDSWMSLPDLENCRVVLVRSASMGVQGCFRPLSAWFNAVSSSTCTRCRVWKAVEIQKQRIIVRVRAVIATECIDSE